MALVALAECHQRLGFFQTSEEQYQRARQAAERAFQINAGQAEVRLKMAEILAFYDRNWAGAQGEWSRARDLNPMLTSYNLPHLLLWIRGMGSNPAF